MIEASHARHRGALSRQELFEVVAVHGYRRFDEIVESHGRGCDNCKPEIASILASLHNGHVLGQETRAMWGGLERVREVVVDDALGLGAELEAEMARHVGGYFDEWRATLDDPEKLGRFVSFVNAPGVPDPNIRFVVDERGQIAPEVSAEPAVLGVTPTLGQLGLSIPVGAP